MLILEEICVGCGHCVVFCPVEAISVYGVAEIDQEKCKKCELCISYCPNDAISGDN